MMELSGELPISVYQCASVVEYCFPHLSWFSGRSWLTHLKTSCRGTSHATTLMIKPVAFFRVRGASLLAIFLGRRFGTKEANRDVPATIERVCCG